MRPAPVVKVGGSSQGKVPMSTKQFLLAIAGAALLASPVLAQHHQGNSNGMPQGPASGHWHGSGAPLGIGSPSTGHPLSQ